MGKTGKVLNTFKKKYFFSNSGKTYDTYAVGIGNHIDLFACFVSDFYRISGRAGDGQGTAVHDGRFIPGFHADPFQFVSTLVLNEHPYAGIGRDVVVSLD